MSTEILGTTTAQILRDALQLIEDPNNWTEGATARNSDGRPTSPRACDAVRWCAVGALYARGNGDSSRTLTARSALNYAALALYDAFGGIVEVNDYYGHAAVIACYREALND